MSRSLEFSQRTYVDIEVSLEEIVEKMDAEDKAEMLKLLGQSVPFGLGDGDSARRDTTVERAYLAAKALPNCPRDLADLFWHVHGRAM